MEPSRGKMMKCDNPAPDSKLGLYYIYVTRGLNGIKISTTVLLKKELGMIL